MSRNIRIKRGLKQNLPTLALAEMGFTTDEKRLYIGHGEGNIALPTQADLALKSDRVFNTEGTLPSSGWQGETVPYTQDIRVNGILDTDKPILDCTFTGNYEDDIKISEEWGKIYRAVSSENNITFYANDKTVVNIPFSVKAVR